MTHATAYVWATNSPAFASFNSLPPSPPSRAAWRRTPALIKSRVSSSTGLISGVPAIGNAASICQGTYHEKEGSVELFEAGTDQQEAEASAGAATDRLELRGPIIDLLTPFTSEGDVDFAAFGEYLRVRPHPIFVLILLYYHTCNSSAAVARYSNRTTALITARSVTYLHLTSIICIKYSHSWSYVRYSTNTCCCTTVVLCRYSVPGTYL